MAFHFKDSDRKPKIIIETSLQSYFYEKLNEANRKSLVPLPDEAIFYSSEVLNKYSEPGKFFEIVEGKPKEKILGMKFLEANLLGQEERKRVLKDVGDTALCLCGLFSGSMRGKIVDENYYRNLGKMAYGRLNAMVPEVLNFPSFYVALSQMFESMTMLISHISLENDGLSILKKYGAWLESRSEDLKRELYTLGVVIDEVAEDKKS